VKTKSEAAVFVGHYLSWGNRGSGIPEEYSTWNTFSSPAEQVFWDHIFAI